MAQPNNQQSISPKKHPPHQIVLLVVLILLLVGVWGWYFMHRTSGTKSNSNASIQNTNQTGNVNTKAVLPYVVTYKGADGKNALELLQAAHSIVEQNGFVQVIDGRSNSKTFYWMLYVNGKSSSVGANDLQTTSSDTLEWRYEQFTTNRNS